MDAQSEAELTQFVAAGTQPTRLRGSRPPRNADDAATLDPVGVVLLGAAVLCVLLPFIEQRSWYSPLRLLLFPLAAVLLVLWVAHERRYGRTREPVVNLNLFKIRSYVLGAGVGLLYFAGFTGTFFILTQYLQSGLCYSALEAGLSATPFAIGGALIASFGARRVLSRGRKLVAFGLATVIVGYAAMWAAVGVEPGESVALFTALSQVPVARAGSAGGVLQTGQRVGSAAGIAVTGSVFYATLASTHGDYATAFRDGVLVIAAFVAAALLLAVADVLTG